MGGLTCWLATQVAAKEPATWGSINCTVQTLLILFLLTLPGARKNAITEKIARFICKGTRPTDKVSGEGFQDTDRTGAAIWNSELRHTLKSRSAIVWHYMGKQRPYWRVWHSHEHRWKDIGGVGCITLYGRMSFALVWICSNLTEKSDSSKI